MLNHKEFYYQLGLRVRNRVRIYNEEKKTKIVIVEEYRTKNVWEVVSNCKMNK